jgi:hypothetical protein
VFVEDESDCCCIVIWLSVYVGVRPELSSIESVDQREYCRSGGGVAEESGGLGFPRIAERIEYSRLAASEPNGKLGSKDDDSMSLCGNGSPGKSN